MKKYLEFKIMKKNVIIIIFAIIVALSIGGYTVWCSYHPDIEIQIGKSTAGENLNIEAPHVAVAERFGIKTASSVQLYITDLVMQHEFICQYVQENYKSADIKLSITVENNQTFLNYSGIVISFEDKQLDFNEEIICDYVLNAKINQI